MKSGDQQTCITFESPSITRREAMLIVVLKSCVVFQNDIERGPEPVGQAPSLSIREDGQDARRHQITFFFGLSFEHRYRPLGFHFLIQQSFFTEAVPFHHPHIAATLSNREARDTTVNSHGDLETIDGESQERG